MSAGRNKVTTNVRNKSVKSKAKVVKRKRSSDKDLEKALSKKSCTDSVCVEGDTVLCSASTSDAEFETEFQTELDYETMEQQEKQDQQV